MMSARIQQARISDEYVAGDARSHRNGTTEPASAARDSNEEIEFQRWTNARTRLENHALRKLLVDLLRAVDAAEVRLPESHLAAVKRDLMVLESRTLDPDAPHGVREHAAATKPQGDRSIEHDVQAYGPLRRPVPQSEFIAQYAHMIRN
jgi:hypothetical protein